MTQEEFELKLQQISEQLEHIIKLYINIEAAFELAYSLELERQDLLKFCSHPKTQYWDDPSRNNRVELQCQICNAWLYR